MNYRLVFISLFILPFNYVLTNNDPEWKKDWKELGVQLLENGYTEDCYKEINHFRKKHKSSRDAQEKLKTFWENRNCFGLEQAMNQIEFSALARAEDQNEQLFKKELEECFHRFPPHQILSSIAKKLKEKSNFENLSPDERLRNRSSFHFLHNKFVAQKKIPWWQALYHDHPILNSIAILGMGFVFGLKGCKKRAGQQPD